MSPTVCLLNGMCRASWRRWTSHACIAPMTRTALSRWLKIHLCVDWLHVTPQTLAGFASPAAGQDFKTKNIEAVEALLLSAIKDVSCCDTASQQSLCLLTLLTD